MRKLKRISKTEILEVREIIRLFVKKSLDSNKKIEAASKATGISLLYLKKSLLGEKNKGGLNAWFFLLTVIAKMSGDDLNTSLDLFFSRERPFRSEASESEKNFQKA